MKKVVLFWTTILAVVTFAEKTPQEVTESLYALTNLWGKTGGLQEYWTTRSAVVTQLAKYDDGEAVRYNWDLFLVDFISRAPSTSPEWLNEGGVEMMLMSRTSRTQQSTNCWFKAADYLRVILTMRNDALVKWQIIDKKLTGTYSFDNDLTSEWHAARNKYVDINNSIGTLAWTVTNSFPSAILPTSPAAEGATLYTNVLRRAGLVK